MVKVPLCVIGPSNYFKSGLTSYTQNIIEIFHQSSKFQLSAIFLNKFIPKRLFPGKNRNIDDFPLILPQKLPFFNGIDWFLFPSLIKAYKFLTALENGNNQSFLVQWWTSSVLHIYLTVIFLIKNKNPYSKVILEIHEIYDPLEQKIKPLGLYVNFFFPLLLKKTDYILFHSLNEAKEFSKKFWLENSKIRFVKHVLPVQKPKLIFKVKSHSNSIIILYFGLIRDYKGIPLLLNAFNSVMDILELEIRNNVLLNIIGEIWDEKKEIFSIINASKYKNKIKIVPKYIPDNDISEIFNNSDFLVLPYLRGTQSGVLHLGMNYNLPIITTDVGGFKDVLVDYNPKIIVPPNDINSLTQAILKMIHMSNSSSSSKITSSVKVSKGVNESYIKTISNLTKNDFIS